MTTTNEVTQSVLLGNGVTKIFPTNIDFVGSKPILLVQIYSAENLLESTLVQGVHYTLSLTGSPTKAVVTYPISGAPLASGKKILFVRQTADTQTLTLTDLRGFFPETMQAVLDENAFRDQEIRTQLKQAPKFSPLSGVVDVVFPTPVPSTTLVYNALGKLALLPTSIPSAAVASTSYSITAFGAVGNDSTDNTVAIQAALDAGAGLDVIIPPGTFRHGRLFIPSNTRIIGTGGTLKPIASISTTQPVFQPYDISSVDNARLARDIWIINVKIDGSLRIGATWLSKLDGTVIADPLNDYLPGGALTQTPAVSAITQATFTASFSGGAVTSVAVNTGGANYGAGTYTATEVQLRFTGGGGYGATGYAVRTGGAITSVVIINGGWNYTSAPTVVTLGGYNDISRLVQPAIDRRNPNYVDSSTLLYMAKVDGGGITDCEFTNYPYMCIVDAGCRDFKIENNVFVNVGKGDGTFPAVWVQSFGNPDIPPVSFQNTQNAQVKGNTFRNIKRLAVLFAPTRGGLCNDNFIENAFESGIFVPQNACQNGGQIVIANNEINNILVSDIVAHGIELNSGARSIKIRSNRIFNATGGAVIFNGVTDCEFITNTAVNCGGTTSTLPYGPFSERYAFNVGTAPIAGNNMIEPVMDIGYAGGFASQRIRIEDNTFVENRAVGELRTFIRQYRAGAAPSPLCRATRIVGNFVSMIAGVTTYDATLTPVFASADELTMHSNTGVSAWSLSEDLDGNLIHARKLGTGINFNGLSVAKDQMIRAASTLNLRSGLRLILDSGDAGSYTTGQVWTDLSGQANNYNRGTTSGAEATDPTFNGVAGDLSNREYFSFDGGDYLTPTGVPTFGSTWHRSTAKFTLAMVINPGTVGTGWRLFSTMNTAASDTGMFLTVSAGGLVQLLVYNAGVVVASPSHSVALVAGADHFVALSVDLALSADRSIFQVNSLQETPVLNYTSPSAGASTGNATIFAGTAGSLPAPASSRLGFVGAWDTVALTKAQLNQLYLAAKARWTGV